MRRSPWEPGALLPTPGLGARLGAPPAGGGHRRGVNHHSGPLSVARNQTRGRQQAPSCCPCFGSTGLGWDKGGRAERASCQAGRSQSRPVEPGGHLPGCHELVATAGDASPRHSLPFRPRPRRQLLQDDDRGHWGACEMCSGGGCGDGLLSTTLTRRGTPDLARAVTTWYRQQWEGQAAGRRMQRPSRSVAPGPGGAPCTHRLYKGRRLRRPLHAAHPLTNQRARRGGHPAQILRVRTAVTSKSHAPHKPLSPRLKARTTRSCCVGVGDAAQGHLQSCVT